MGCFLDLDIWIKKPFGDLLLRMLQHLDAE